jgi:2-keto-3-deoxy-L-rhamnonate aldolase RhmA
LGQAMTQLVQALRYKPEGRRFDSRWCHWNFSFMALCVLMFIFLYLLLQDLGQKVTQLVEALRYKPEGKGFDSPWCHWNFSLT